jgi:transcriptional regulator GlxA family with amidase domain
MKTIAILVMPGAQPLEIIGPYEIFSIADALAQNPEWGGTATFRPVLVSAQKGTVNLRYNITISTHEALSDRLYDAIVVPGGAICESLSDSSLHQWIARHASTDSVDTVASVCYGAFMLGHAGVLNGLSATTHWEDTGDLAKSFPSVKVQTDQRVVDQGRIVTSAGNTAGLDLALQLVAKWHSQSLADRVAKQIEYQTKC